MSLFAELKRRNVFKVGATYAVLAWVLMQVAAIMLPAFSAPAWVLRVFLFFLLLGFPFALLAAWAFELTTDGIKPTSEVDPAASIRQQTGQKLNVMITGSVILLLVIVMIDQYLLEDAPAENAAGITAAASELPGSASAPAPAVVEQALSTAAIPNSLAVLPFGNFSPDPDDAYFAAGLHDEILNQLARLRNMKVISRQSVLRYADTQLTIPEIARELRVSNIMEGTVRYSGNRIRVTAQLIDAATDEHLWSETFDVDFADIFEAESQIAMNVANAMQVSFSPEEQAQLERIPTNSSQAYALYLQAVGMGGGFPGSDTVNRMLELLDQAIAIDPEFADAYMFKGNIYRVMQQFDLANLNIDKAVALEPAFFDKNLVQATNLNKQFRYQDALVLVETLLLERPNDPDLLLAAVEAYAGLGNWEEALRFATRSLEVEKSAGSYNQMGIINARLGQHELAIQYFQRQIELTPQNSTPQLEIAYSLASLGRVNEAVSWITSAKTLTLGVNEENDANPNIYSALIYANALAGQQAEVQRLFAMFKTMEAQADLPTKARAYVSAGELEQALAFMEQMVSDKSLNNWNSVNATEFLKLNPHKLPALERPEFVAVREQLAD